MIIFLANEFLSRQDLEDSIKNQCGTDSSINQEMGHKIMGTRAELKKLFLDDTRRIWGVKVEITDTPITQVLQRKLEMSQKVEKSIKLGKKSKKKLGKKKK